MEEASTLKTLADRFSLSDNFHQSFQGGTGANHFMLGTGDAAFWSDGKGNPITPPASEIANPNPVAGTTNKYTADNNFTNCSDFTQPGVAPIVSYLEELPYRAEPNCAEAHYYMLDNTNPGFLPNGFQAPSPGTQNMVPPSPVRTIGDALNERKITWAYFGGSYNDAVVLSNEAVAAGTAGTLNSSTALAEAAVADPAHSLGVAYWIRGDLARAEELLMESIDLFAALAGSPERIPSPVNIAEIRMGRSDDRPGVRVVFEDTLQPFVEISCDAAVSYVLANQAGIARARGDMVRARALLDQSAARFKVSGDAAGTAAVLVRLAYLELTEGALSAARLALEKALEIRRSLGDRRGFGLALAGLGFIDTTAGDHLSAEQHLAEASDLFRRAGDRWALASTLWRTADLAFARGNLDDAEAALLEARTVLVPTQRERWIANTLAGLAEVALLRGDEKRATELLIDARERYAARHDVVGAADAEERLAGIAKGL